MSGLFEVENQISDQIKHLSVAMYLWMEKTNNWGDFTKAAIVQHYCFYLLRISLAAPLNPEHISKFEEEVIALSEKYKLADFNCFACFHASSLVADTSN